MFARDDGIENDKIRFKKALKIALEEMETSDPSHNYSSGSPSHSSSPSPSPYVPRAFQQPTAVDTLSIDGYIDKELESYMMINDMKSAIPFKDDGTSPKKPKDMDAFEKETSLGAPFIKNNQFSPSPASSRRSSPNSLLTDSSSAYQVKTGDNVRENFTKKYKIIFDLLLFAISGILIILMLEQLFKMALLSGMNKTILALEKIIDNNTNLQPNLPTD